MADPNSGAKVALKATLTRHKATGKGAGAIKMERAPVVISADDYRTYVLGNQPAQ